MNHLVAGSVAGLVATVPMTLVMKALYRELPPQERYPLPPKQITREIAEEADLEEVVEPGPDWEAATYLSHFAYGAAVGGVYGLVGRHIPGPPVVQGVVFGSIVWTVSYLGWLPLAHILPSATREPARRNALMLAAHAVWGGVAGLTTDAINKQRRK